MKLDIRKQHCTAFCNYGVKRSGTFDSIEIHSIGCAQNTASAIRNNMNQHSPSGIVHAIVDAETEGLVLEILPDNNVAWADAGKGNRCSFTIEISESDYMRYTGGANYVVTDRAKFNADMIRGYNTAVYYVAKKCKEFGFDPLKKTSDGLYTVYSHREANLKGLASGHVDPTHIWDPLGWSMDKFRADVKKVMNGENVSVTIGSSSATTTATTSTMYYVRKSWDNKTSQLGAYSVVDNAKKICDQNKGYFVFDSNGKVVYPTETATLQKNETVTTVKPQDYTSHKAVLTGTSDKIWMGWLKRESGSKGYICTNGDAGHAQGAFQFDNRYALVPFMQYCVDKYPTHYSDFKKYISYGVGSASLVGNTALANLWTSYCEKYWDEFASLQDAYAYKYYYLEAKKYIKNLYGIEMDNHSPAVKGTLWSMAIRSGALTGARKFEGCNDKTSDSEMLRIAYSKYGSEDANRWTKAGQYGDAIKALENNEFLEIATEGTSVSAPATPTTTPSTTTDNNYYVRKSFSDKSTQLGCYISLSNAKKVVDANPGYSVFDSKGTQVYPVPTISFKPYQVQTIKTNVPVRKSPSALATVVTKIVNIGTYTIVEESKNGKWGLLKAYESSRSGWIYLKNTKKV